MGAYKVQWTSHQRQKDGGMAADACGLARQSDGRIPQLTSCLTARPLGCLRVLISHRGNLTCIIAHLCRANRPGLGIRFNSYRLVDRSSSVGDTQQPPVPLSHLVMSWPTPAMGGFNCPPETCSRTTHFGLPGLRPPSLTVVSVDGC